MTWTARFRRLQPGETPPAGEPRRYTMSNGYVVLRWKVGVGEYVECLEHRLVAGAVVGEQVHHRNRVRNDNELSNLERLSPAEHAAEHAVYDAANIARFYGAGFSLPDISHAIGCDTATALRALRRVGVRLRSQEEARQALKERERFDARVSSLLAEAEGESA